jgi:hypothetical protein
VGHDLPQEAPSAFADALVDADRMAAGEGSATRSEQTGVL